MMTIKKGRHLIYQDREIVRVFDEAGNFMAAIYPTESGVKIISKHLLTMRDVLVRPVTINWEPPPTVHINFVITPNMVI